MVDLVCTICGNPYSVKPYQVSNSRCCSEHCRRAHTAKRNARPLSDRFWKKVDKRGENECWPWIGAQTFGGYGVIGVGGERLIRAHRFSYEIHKGEIPGGQVIRHTCDNPACVNPSHLLVGTMKDNTADMLSRGRTNPRLKLTKAQVAAIRRSDGTVRALATKYGVSFGLISMIKNGHRR